MAAPRLTSWSRFGAYQGEITSISSFVHKAKLNGEDSITFEVLESPTLAKGSYLLWRDYEDEWHEHIVTNIEQTHSSNRRSWKVYAVMSMCELAQDYVIDKRPGAQTPTTASAALASILDGTRWDVGPVDLSTRGGTTVYHKTVYDGLSALVKEWGGQMVPRITVDPLTGVTARAIEWRDHLGHVTPQRRLEFGHDLGGITRTVDDASPITAVYAWGKGEQLDSGGYGRRIGIEDVTPDGLPYVHDDSLLPIWGILGPDGTPQHRFGELVDGNCEDPAKLLEEANAYLEQHSQPTVSYKGDVAAYADVGADVEGLHLGDELQAVDRGLDVRVQARVIEISRDYVDRSKTKVTLGNFLGTLADQFASLKADVSGLVAKSSGLDVVSEAGSSYLDAVITTLNAMFNASGGYVNFYPTTGITVMDADNFDDATKAMNISGAGFRIANSKSGTEWVWRTFGTGDGFVADQIITGILTAIRIQSAIDPTNYLDLATGKGYFSQLVVGKIGTSETNYATIGADDAAYFNSNDGSTFRTSGSGIIYYREGVKAFEIIDDGSHGTFLQTFGTDGSTVVQQIYLPKTGSPVIKGSGGMTFSVDSSGMAVRKWEAGAGGTGGSKVTVIPPGYTLTALKHCYNTNNGYHYYTTGACPSGWTEQETVGYVFVAS